MYNSVAQPLGMWLLSGTCPLTRDMTMPRDMPISHEYAHAHYTGICPCPLPRDMPMYYFASFLTFD